MQRFVKQFLLSVCMFFFSMSRLSLPAVKFNITDLAQSSAISSEQQEILDLKTWCYRVENQTINYSIVWIQGTVIQVRNLNRYFYYKCLSGPFGLREI